MVGLMQWKRMSVWDPVMKNGERGVMEVVEEDV
jgi:hypothetical protein